MAFFVLIRDADIQTDGSGGVRLDITAWFVDTVAHFAQEDHVLVPLSLGPLPQLRAEVRNVLENFAIVTYGWPISAHVRAIFPDLSVVPPS